MQEILCGLLLALPVRSEAKMSGSMPVDMLEKAQGQKHEFKAKTSRVMSLFINSLYTNDEVFVRELLSNASDSLSKLRTQALVDKSISTEGLEMAIELDKKNNALVFKDNGVGMTREELVKNLGTIAESGTTEFLKKVDEGTDINSLIGHFGVGFYSAFLVSDRIVVVSRSHKGGKQHVWDCDAAASEYTVYEDPRGETMEHGIEISLYLKKNKIQNYLSEERLKAIVKKYGEFYLFPIYLRYEKEVTKEIGGESEEKKGDTEKGDTEKDATEKKDAAEKSTITTIEVQSDLLNANKPIWKRDPSEVTDEEYKTFYKTLTNDSTEPLAWKHFRMEGNVEFAGIMFVPRDSMYNPYRSSEGSEVSLSLHVKHVFITNDAELLPKHLSFVRGVIDSDGLPLNVSRELLQNNKIIKLIRKRLLGKLAELVGEIAQDKGKYERFYETHGGSIRMEVYKNPKETRFAEFLRYHSSLHKTEKISLEQYVEKMKAGQNKIFYFAGETLSRIRQSAYIEALLANEFPVLYLLDPLDEPTLLNLGKYKKLSFQDTAKDGLSLGMPKEELQGLKKKFQPLADTVKRLLLDSVEDVKVSQRLTKTSCAVVAQKDSWSPNMERVVGGQIGASNDKMAAFYRTQKKIFEINPQAPLITELNDLVVAGKITKEHEKCIRILYDSALVRSGMPVKNTNAFSANVETMVEKTLGVSGAGKRAADYEEIDLSKRKDIERREKYEKEKKKNRKEAKERKKKDKEEGVEADPEEDAIEDEDEDEEEVDKKDDTEDKKDVNDEKKGDTEDKKDVDDEKKGDTEDKKDEDKKDGGKQEL
ncbi:MAG: heat shock protein 90, HSP90B family [Amphiamblys sp. WSBS2006]|nr:MAG: heat shock protein 90, HSP90B family [Amphiamblys sp. WSBS2006]